jgi:hypothetical protein
MNGKIHLALSIFLIAGRSGPSSNEKSSYDVSNISEGIHFLTLSSACFDVFSLF